MAISARPAEYVITDDGEWAAINELPPPAYKAFTLRLLPYSCGYDAG